MNISQVKTIFSMKVCDKMVLEDRIFERRDILNKPDLEIFTIKTKSGEIIDQHICMKSTSYTKLFGAINQATWGTDQTVKELLQYI